MRIGIVSPYSFDVPGGVQNHIMDLAEALIGLGHQVSVLAPADEDADLPPYVVPAGRAVPLPYNGSVARIAFGPVSTARVRRWLSPRRSSTCCTCTSRLTLSLSLLAVLSARGPVVATFHTAMTRSRALAAAQGLLQLVFGEDHRPDRGQRTGPQGAGRAPRRGRGGDPQRGGGGQVRRRPSRCRAGPARAARWASWAGSPSRARASRCCATAFVALARRPARPAPAGRRPGRPGRPVRRASRPTCTTGSPSWAWSPRRTRPGCCAASTSTWRRTPAASPSA